MRQSRLYTDQPLQAGSRVELDARAAHYVTQVLRLRKGQSLTLFNGDGHDWSAELDYCGRRDCRVHVLEILEAESLPRRALHGFMLDHRAKVSLAGSDEPAGDIALLVGPEGGLAAPERQLAARHGFTAVRLGPRVLRTETAPLAALAAIQTLWGDFR